MTQWQHLIGKAATAAVVILVAAACGSTLPTPEQQAAEVAEEGGLGAPGNLPPGTHVNEQGEIVNEQGEVVGTVDGSGGGSAGGYAPGGTAGGGSGGSAVGGGSSGGGGVDSSAPGVTASTISLGLPIVVGATAGNRSFGASAATGLDSERAWRALVEDINKRGGIASHNVKPVFHKIDLVSSKSSQQQAQEACAHWTEDEPVFAAMVGDSAEESFFACMERHGAAMVTGNTIGTFYDNRFYDRYPHTIAPYSINLNAQSEALVEGLVDENYFGKAPRIGLIIFDLPGFQYATAKSLVPALRRHGLELTDTAEIHYPNSYSEYGQMSGELNNAAVRFKAGGITHVMILDIRANAGYFFGTAAEKQEYRPRYGITSQSGNSGLAELLGDDARNQLHGARSIGWVPVADLTAEDDPWKKSNRTRRYCIELMRKNGVELTSRNSEHVALLMCGQLWGLEASIEAGGRTITPDSMVQGATEIESSFVSPLTFVTGMTQQNHDGVQTIANMKFIDKCRCFRYISRPYPVGN